MKVLSEKEFGERAKSVLKSKEPLIILRQREVAGIFSPTPLKSIPVELKKELLITLSSSIKKILDAKGIKEEEILEDFEKYRKTRRRC